MINRVTGFVCVAVLVCAVGSGLRAQEAVKPLYDRLGGKTAVTAVASGLVDRILQDRRVNAWFAHAASSPENTAAYKGKLYEFLCQATGGPCTYTGLDMVAAHKGRAVTGGAFDAVVEDLVAVLDELRVPAPERQEVLALVATLKSAIVQR